jgi:nicotinamidase-related amidase
MPNPNTAAAASFQNADAYEQVMGQWSRRLAPLLIRFSGLYDGDRVLDVGCGTGSLTFTVPGIGNRPHCVEGTWGAEIIDEQNPQEGERLVIKKGFGVASQTRLSTRSFVIWG